MGRYQKRSLQPTTESLGDNNGKKTRKKELKANLTICFNLSLLGNPQNTSQPQVPVLWRLFTQSSLPVAFLSISNPWGEEFLAKSPFSAQVSPSSPSPPVQPLPTPVPCSPQLQGRFQSQEDSRKQQLNITPRTPSRTSPAAPQGSFSLSRGVTLPKHEIIKYEPPQAGHSRAVGPLSSNPGS